MITKKQRWMGWLAALFVTLLAVQWVDSGESPPAVPASAPAAAVRATAGSTLADSVPASDIRLDRLKREPHPAPRSDLFKGDLPVALRESSEAYGENGRPLRSQGPPPPPPLPFTYMGKMLEDGQTVVFLTRGERNYVVRKGSTIDGQYRVDGIADRSMVLTYLPARVRQSLAIGSPP